MDVQNPKRPKNFSNIRDATYRARDIEGGENLSKNQIVNFSCLVVKSSQIALQRKHQEKR